MGYIRIYSLEIKSLGWKRERTRNCGDYGILAQAFLTWIMLSLSTNDEETCPSSHSTCMLGTCDSSFVSSYFSPSFCRKLSNDCNVQVIKVLKGNLGNELHGSITYPTDVQIQMREQIEHVMRQMNISSFSRNYIEFRKLIDVEQPKRVVRIEELAKRIQDRERVLVTFTNYPYLDQFYVSYMTSRLWKYSNFMVVALDRKAYDVLSIQGFPVALIKTAHIEQYDIVNTSNYGEHSFNVIMKLKLVIIHKILSLGLSCLMFDSDVVIFKDPFSGFPQKDFDFVAQMDEHICAGFIFFKPTDMSFKLIEMAIDRMKGREINDQDAIQEIVGGGMLPGLRWEFLPTQSYSKGSIYFNNHQFPWSLPCRLD